MSSLSRALSEIGQRSLGLCHCFEGPFSASTLILTVSVLSTKRLQLSKANRIQWHIHALPGKVVACERLV